MEIVRLQDFRLSWLHTFICVCNNGGYSAAAKILKVSQPTVTRRIQLLEAWCGQDILTENIPPRLTEFGEKFLDESQSIITYICDINKLVVKNTIGDLLTDQEKEKLRAFRVFKNNTKKNE